MERMNEEEVRRVLPWVMRLRVVVSSSGEGESKLVRDYEE